MKRTPIILLMIIVALLVLTYIISYKNDTLHMRSAQSYEEATILEHL